MNKKLDKKLFFVYNPYSGREKLRDKLYGILDEFSLAGYEVTAHPTMYARDAYESVAALPDGYDLVVAAGGDGTLDEVVSAMIQREHKIPIGYIPAGSTNDYAKSLRIPSDMRAAAAAAVQGRPFTVDTGLFNGRSFTYCAAFGLFTEVSYATSRTLKNLFGHMAYVLEGAKSLLDVKSYKMKVETAQMSFKGDFIYGMVSNSKSVGGFKSIVGKNVLFDDGLFEVTFIRRPRNPGELGEILTALMNGRLDTEYIYSFKSAHVTVRSKKTVPWAHDGEPGGEWTRTVISVSPRAVDINIPCGEWENLTAGK